MIFEWFFFAEEKHPRNDHNIDTGLMQQMSIFYAMGFSLAAQGAFSVCYHVCFFFLFHNISSNHSYIFFFLGMPNKPQSSIWHNYDVCHLYSLLCQTLSIQTPRCNSQCLFNSVRSWCFGSYWSPGSLLVFVDCVWAFPVLLCGHDYFHCFWCLLSWHR